MVYMHKLRCLASFQVMTRAIHELLKAIHDSLDQGKSSHGHLLICSFVGVRCSSAHINDNVECGPV